MTNFMEAKKMSAEKGISLSEALMLMAGLDTTPKPERVPVATESSSVILNLNKKYDKAAIMKKAWGIAKNSAAEFGGKASEYIDESLRMSWTMAKIDKFETTLFLLDMKDLSGGRSNTAAQMQIAENNKAIDSLTAEINSLRAKIA